LILWRRQPPKKKGNFVKPAPITRPAPSGQAVSIYDGLVLVGIVIERSDGSGFDAVDADGKYLGTFSSRATASRAIPTRAAS
jgi:hypothetical protein